MPADTAEAPRSFETLTYNVPVYVEVDKGKVVSVTVDDTAAVCMDELPDGDARQEAFKVAEREDWPAWRIGY